MSPIEHISKTNTPEPTESDYKSQYFSKMTEFHCTISQAPQEIRQDLNRIK